MSLTHSRTGMAALAVFAISSGTLIGAWGFEYIGGYLPCPLCLRQRWPYYIVICLSFGLLYFCLQKPHAAMVRYGLFVCGVLMLTSAGLGFHHAGVEWGWWPGPDSCAGGAGLSSGSILPDLNSAKVVSCTEVQWRFAGLSFAGWNGVISLLTAFIAFWGAKKTN